MIMIRNLIMSALVAVGLAFAAGCASTQVADDLSGQKLTLSPAAKDVAHVYGRTWGFYCLWIPLITGDTEKPGSAAWFTDTVTVKAVTKMVTAKSKALGASNTLDVKSNTSGLWIMPVFFINSVEVSGNAVVNPVK